MTDEIGRVRWLETNTGIQKHVIIFFLSLSLFFIRLFIYLFIYLFIFTSIVSLLFGKKEFWIYFLGTVILNIRYLMKTFLFI